MYIIIQCNINSRDKGSHLLCSLLHPQHLEGSLAHTMYSINIYPVNERIVDIFNKSMHRAPQQHDMEVVEVRRKGDDF